MRQSRLIEGEFRSQDVAAAAASLHAGLSDGDESARAPMTGHFHGWMWMTEIQPGLTGSACDLVSLADTTIANQVERSVRIELRLHGEQGGFRPQGVGLPPDHLERVQVYGLGENRFCTRELPAGKRHSRISLIVKPTFLDSCASAIPSPDLDILAHLMAPGCHGACLPRSDPLLTMSRAVIDDPYRGSLGAMFRESAIVQILCQTLGLLRDKQRAVQEIGSRHYDAVHRAQELLDAALLEPPSTIDLARQVGINRNALQAGFRTVFGTTIFGYVRDQRLRMARILIQEHRMGAAEAGYRVGFRSPSAFSAAYRKAFACAPTDDMLSVTPH